MTFILIRGAAIEGWVNVIRLSNDVMISSEKKNNCQEWRNIDEYSSSDLLTRFHNSWTFINSLSGQTFDTAVWTLSPVNNDNTIGNNFYSHTVQLFITFAIDMKFLMFCYFLLLALIFPGSEAYQTITLWDGENYTYPAVEITGYELDLSKFDFDDITSSACVAPGL